MSAIRCSVEIIDEDVLIDLEGGSDVDRRALLTRTGRWAMKNRSVLGATAFRLIAGETEGELFGGCVSIDAESHCVECASRRAAKWLRAAGIEVTT